MIADALRLARVDLLLELRRREVVASMLLLVAGTLIAVGLLFDRTADPRTLVALLWVALLFTAIVGLLRAFAAEREAGIFDALALAPVDRASIWLGKALSQLVFIVAVQVLAVPIFLAAILDGGIRVGPFVVALLLADIGLAAVGVLAAALAAAARAREVLLPVLLLPFAIPLVLAGVTASVQAIEGGAVGRSIGFLALYDTLFLVLGVGVFDHLVSD